MTDLGMRVLALVWNRSVNYLQKAFLQEDHERQEAVLVFGGCNCFCSIALLQSLKGFSQSLDTVDTGCAAVQSHYF
jgi:hypothetical protein